jgi:hypothetical protein
VTTKWNYNEFGENVQRDERCKFQQRVSLQQNRIRKRRKDGKRARNSGKKQTFEGI